MGEALGAGVGAGRLRGADLEQPFHGARALPRTNVDTDPWAALRAEMIWLARAYAPLLRDDQFFSHETAAAIWGAPMYASGPVVLHVSVMGTGVMPQRRGVQGHRAQPVATTTRVIDGLRVASFATMWAMLGTDHSRDQLVAVGDFGCRVWREGIGRPDPGRAPITTLEQLEAAMNAIRRRGISRLRQAHPLIRTDAWSPRETKTRLILVDDGLPEPELNRDVFDEFGGFLGCVDLAYPEYKVAVEYQGQLHGEQYARDLERIERLRAAGWTVIQVSSDTLRYPNVVTRRVFEALLARGWRPNR
ncbi:endonuclease domain-containing protein [Microbacterium sorbitolivorans]|uniref:endonuclease domain-containing protein n=1 Tax=Microbacterium sorbitolivorans TaxID=1867410 RepID=UPI0013B06A73|nr:DUF559 domain-containing protein [Microbacterium sorbitolivorans]